MAISWSSASHWILGVPSGLVQRARREGGETEERVIALLQINVSRLKNIQRAAGLMLAGIVSFMLTVFVMLGFYYRIEFFQALSMISFPMVLVGLLSMRTVRKLDEDLPTGDDLYKLFRRLRLSIQFIGLISIFITSMWGMLYLITVSSFPGA